MNSKELQFRILNKYFQALRVYQRLVRTKHRFLKLLTYLKKPLEFHLGVFTTRVKKGKESNMKYLSYKNLFIVLNAEKRT